jgi:flavin-dependent dehydrogenase
MLNRLGVDTTGWKRNYGLRVYNGHGESFSYPWPDLAKYPNYGLTVRRSEFDDVLAGHAVSRGAKLVTGANVRNPIRNKATGRIEGVQTANGTRYTAPVVIAADGNASRLALRMGIPNWPDAPMGVAVRSYFTSPHDDIDVMESWVELGGKDSSGNAGFETVSDAAASRSIRNLLNRRSGETLNQRSPLPGYGWIFPMGDGTVNVGVGMLNSSAQFRDTDYRKLLRDWTATLPPEWGITPENMTEPIRGASLPMGFRRVTAQHQGLLLVGDAAGMVSPFNGEGISYAMESGELAADAVTEAHARGFGSPAADRALTGYSTSLKQGFGDYYQFGAIFVRLIGMPGFMRVCLDYGLPRYGLMKLVHKLLAGLSDGWTGNAEDRFLAAAVWAVARAEHLVPRSRLRAMRKER